MSDQFNLNAIDGHRNNDGAGKDQGNKNNSEPTPVFKRRSKIPKKIRTKDDKNQPSHSRHDEHNTNIHNNDNNDHKDSMTEKGERHNGHEDEHEGPRWDELEKLRKLNKFKANMRKQIATMDKANQQISNHAKQNDADEETGILESLGGLKSSFAQEKSEYDIEKQMENYINERIPESLNKSYLGNPENTGGENEDDLYKIPADLQARRNKFAYDPGEGLPAAGLEEYDLPIEFKVQNIEDTEKARKKVGNVFKRNNMATDNLVADRLRKRFRN